MSKHAKPLPPELLEVVQLFQSCGLNEQLSLKYAKDDKLAPRLRALAEGYRLPARDLEPKQATLVVQLADIGTQLDAQARGHAVDAIADGRLRSTEQVTAAVNFLAHHAYDASEFDQAAGVGITISPEELHKLAWDYVQSQQTPLSDPWAENTNAFNRFRVLDTVRWANKSKMKSTFDAAYAEVHGPKPDLKAKGKAESQATKAARAAAAKPATDVMRNDASTSSAPDMFKEGFLASLHKPGENAQLSTALRDRHLKATGGKVMTRFPPEPNGFLHIGHSRAIAINFGYAKYLGGHCYLRYDDTNPEAEEQIYFDAILEIVRWLGYEPYRITYSSDNFDKLYALAIELIKRDKAYMCFCSPEEIKANRGQITSNGEGPMTYGARRACEHRHKSVEQSLAEFEKMKDGHYEPGAAVLRMKQDLQDGNPQLWDIIAYRTLKASHHRTGSKWKIYPTYDFTHCLCDSIENISHSLCTTEFVQARVSYDWLCNALEVYRPQQREYGRLNIEGTVMSKRKILKLVKEGYVSGWDDPRLYTLIALRRRGVPPGAIVAFINELGVGETAADVSLARFDQAVRSYAERNVPRMSLILRPLRLTVENDLQFLSPDHPGYASSGAAPTYVVREVLPNSTDMGTVRMPYGKTVYIDAADFRTTASSDFQRLVPGGRIGLLGVPATFLCTSFETDPSSGAVVDIICRYEPVPPGTKPPHKVKYIHWIDTEAAVPVDEVRLYGPLFTSAKPDFKSETWLNELNPKSVEVVKGAVIEPSFWEIAERAFKAAQDEARRRAQEAEHELFESRADAPQPSTAQLTGNEVVRFQAMREAYFALDKDASLDFRAKKGRLVLNRFVSLKEDAAKNA